MGPAVGVSFRAADRICPDGVIDLVRHAQSAERFGFADFDAQDHILLMGQSDAHPGASWSWGPESLWPDPLVLLSAVAATTSRIGLTTSIYIAPLRPAIAVAKMTATLDALSGGRLRLGFGAGWAREEFAAAGIPFVGRTARMEDTIGACRALWTTSPASFDSATVSFAGMFMHPQPPRPGGIPILLAGPPLDAVAERVARLAEGWNPMGTHRAELREGVQRVRRAFADAGRDPNALIVRFPLPEEEVLRAYRADDPGALRDLVAELEADGVTDVKIYIPELANERREVDHALEWISTAFELPARSS